MASISYWEASAFLLDSYTTQLLSMKKPIYDKEEHWYRIQRSTLIEKVISIVNTILHHIKAIISKSYKNEFMMKAQAVEDAFQAVTTPEQTNDTVQEQAVVITAEQAVEPELSRLLTDRTSKAFSEAFGILIKSENIKKIDKFLSTTVHLKEPVKLSVTTDEKALLGGRIILLLGVEKELVTKVIKFNFIHDKVTKKDLPKGGDYQSLLGRPIKRMYFDLGFHTYIYYNGGWPLNGYYYPKLSEIGWIDDEHILLRGSLDLGVTTWNDAPRIHTIAQLKANWAAGKPVNDEVSALQVNLDEPSTLF